MYAILVQLICITPKEVLNVWYNDYTHFNYSRKYINLNIR